MSAEDDDDDIWNSENFIATIEVFLQKAEHESAAKHGTQSVFPSASSNFPGTSHSTYNNGLAAKFEPSSAGPKQSYGSSVTRAGYAGRVGDLMEIGPEIRANEPAGRAHTLQPLSYQNPWTVSEVRDVYVSQQSKGLGHDRSGDFPLAVVENEGPALRDILAEKDGAISLLRTRLREAEQQVDELRKRINSQTSFQPAISQQRELERLSSQLLFKLSLLEPQMGDDQEHEVSEVQRVRLEKEEQLKDALQEAAFLREELECLKQSRSTGGDGLKRPRDEGASQKGNSVERHAVTTARPDASVENSTRISERQYDPWTSPWVAERTFSGTPRKASQGGQEKTAAEPSNRLPAGNASPAVATLKKRTAENGCVSSDQNDSRERGKSKAAEVNKRETTAQSQKPETAAGMCELSYSLQQIWGFKGGKNGGKALVAKLYACCAQDLYVLLSNGEYKTLVDSKKMERRKSETMTISEKFHSAVAKVTNGSAPPEIILGPLLEFCTMDNNKLLGSALIVLHCILQHDSNCRQRLVGRRKDDERPLTAFSHMEDKDNFEEDKRGFKVLSKVLANGETKQLPVFSSPRIILSNRRSGPSEPGVASKGDALDNDKKQAGRGISENTDQQQVQEAQHIQIERRGNMGLVEGTVDAKDNSVEGGGDPGSEKPRTFMQSTAPEQTHQDGGGGGSNICDELDPFLKWMLHLALTSTSPVVRLEAVAVIGVLVVHSEPLVGRLVFGPLLKYEGLEILLKESAGVEIQLQAVRIVHHLLHCPTLYRNFCTSNVEEQTFVPNPKHELSEGTKTVLEEPVVLEGNNLRNTVDRQLDAPVAAKGGSGPSADFMKRKLLEGFAECLKFTGTSAQDYALRRSVMRLTTYIASCGDAGVAFLTQTLASLKNLADEPTTVCKDDTKADGIALGESSSGQHIARDGSGLKGLDARSRMISGNDDWEAGHSDYRGDPERVISIPERLVTLLAAELESRDDEGESEASVDEERACLIREVATLLSCLASHPVQSGVVVGFLISNPRIARLTLSVTNDLVSRRSLFQVAGTGQKCTGLSDSETAELCKSLRRRVMRAIAEASEPQL